MVTALLKLRSSIHSDFKKKALFKGSLVGGFGILAMLYGSLYMGAESLGVWGFLIYSMAFGCIADGMIPYRKLCTLEQNPHLLTFTEDGDIDFYFKGKLALSIPDSAIESFLYRRTSSSYGVVLALKNACPKPIHIHGKFGYRISRVIFRHPNLFLPYFSEHSFKLLKQEILEYRDSASSQA